MVDAQGVFFEAWSLEHLAKAWSKDHNLSITSTVFYHGLTILEMGLRKVLLIFLGPPALD